MIIRLNSNQILLNLPINTIDFKFLFFLLLIVQGSIPLKVAGVVLILLFRLKAIFFAHYFLLFYFFIIIYHILYGLYIIAFDSPFYLPNYLLSLIFWVICYITLCQILHFVKVNPPHKLNKTIDLFFFINICVIAFQLVQTMNLYNSINPYGVTNSAGDYIKSIYTNSSVNFIIMSFFSIMYLQRKKWTFGISAVVFLLMTTYMSGLVIFIASMIIGVYLFSNIKIKNKLLIALGVVLFFSIFNYVAPSNVTYASRYINRIIENKEDTPFKIKSFYQTYDYWTSSMRPFVLGAGGGNFSSRVSFIASGDYVTWFPDDLIYSSKEFEQNHLGIWTHDFNNPWDNINNTANQPFSFFNQIVGEYGLIGILLFLYFYLGYILKKWPILTYSKFLILPLTGYFLLDYWYEYFSVIIIFELLLLLDIKHNSRTNYEVQTSNS